MKHFNRYILLCLLAMALGACSVQLDISMDDNIEHDIRGDAVPWTNLDFDESDDRLTIALFSDLTGGERPGIFEVAVEQLSLLRPELIMNVGDLIEGGTEDRAQIARERESFEARANKAKAPIFFTGGNHDLNSLTLRSAWEERYGRRYYHFVYKDVLFLVMDTEDISAQRRQRIADLSVEAVEIFEAQGQEAFDRTEFANLPEGAAGTIGAEQSEYFQQVIAENADVRWTFLFMHKAPWERTDTDTFARIEAALLDRSYTVFHGHQHAYKHQQRYGHDYIQLATTGGIQLPEKGLSVDQVMLLTLTGDELDIVNLRLDGILDKTGHIPLGGDELCFDRSRCGEED